MFRSPDGRTLADLLATIIKNTMVWTQAQGKGAGSACHLLIAEKLDLLIRWKEMIPTVSHPLLVAAVLAAMFLCHPAILQLAQLKIILLIMTRNYMHTTVP